MGWKNQLVQNSVVNPRCWNKIPGQFEVRTTIWNIAVSDVNVLGIMDLFLSFTSMAMDGPKKTFSMEGIYLKHMVALNV